MNCYVCIERGVDRAAVALCRSCSAGLCVEHLRETAARFESDNILAACHHDTWRNHRQAQHEQNRTSGDQPITSPLPQPPGPSRVRRAGGRRGLVRHG